MLVKGREAAVLHNSDRAPDSGSLFTSGAGIDLSKKGLTRMERDTFRVGITKYSRQGIHVVLAGSYKM